MKCEMTKGKEENGSMKEGYRTERRKQQRKDGRNITMFREWRGKTESSFSFSILN